MAATTYRWGEIDEKFGLTLGLRYTVVAEKRRHRNMARPLEHELAVPRRCLPSTRDRQSPALVAKINDGRCATRQRLLVPQGFDRVQTRGAAGRPYAEEQTDAHGNRHARHRRPERNRSRQVRKHQP